MPQAPRHHTNVTDARRVGPVRTCVGCRRTRPKADLVRFVRTLDSIRLDRRQCLPGRGAYVCDDTNCVEAAGHRDGHAVLRALRGGNNEQVHVALAQLAGNHDGAHEEHTA